MFDYLANPSRFMRIANRLLLPLVLSVASLPGLGYLELFPPADYQQGDTVRIIYIHVPAAWLALLGYVGLGVCGLFYIVWRHPQLMLRQVIALLGQSFHFDAYRCALGKADVGSLVGLGCPPDLNAYTVLFLSRFYCTGKWL